MKVFGIDISVWQKGLNYNQAINEGVKFVILRGAYGSVKDSIFDEHFSNLSGKLPLGVYQKCYL